ncbi:phosphoribosylformylglycinamidine synthase subunit PurS [soil metagenome]
MNTYTAEVSITPRAGLLDPEGKAVLGALRSLEFEQVSDVRVGRLVRVTVQAATESAARDGVEAMCRKLLANPVTENFEIDLATDGVA